MTGFRRVPDWGVRPPGWEHGEVAGVAVDAADRVFLLVRADPPVRVYDADGTPLAVVGLGALRAARTGSASRRAARSTASTTRATPSTASPRSGELELTLSRVGDDADYDPLATPGRLEPVTRVGPPFNYPTHAIEAPDGEIHVADGYGNARVHSFTNAGELTGSWGAGGPAPGEFCIPHGLALDGGGRLYVADRLNSRVQLFDRDGTFREEWPARRPNSVAFDAARRRLRRRARERVPLHAHARPRRRARAGLDQERGGEVIGELTASEDGDEQIYFAPHAVAVDRQGAVYVGEVPASYSRGAAPAHAAVLRKYVRAESSSKMVGR